MLGLAQGGNKGTLGMVWGNIVSKRDPSEEEFKYIEIYEVGEPG